MDSDIVYILSGISTSTGEPLSCPDNYHPLGNFSSGSQVNSVAGVKPVFVVNSVTSVENKFEASRTQCQPLAAFNVSSKENVPPIPLPSLGDTVQKLKSIATKMDGRWIQSDLTNFMRKLGDFELKFAPDLQSALESDASTEAGWFAPYWDDMYLTLREPIPINVSFALELDRSGWVSEEGHSSLHLARAILGAYEHLQIILEDKLVVERGSRNQPLCMNQSKRLFGHRRAMPGKDQLVPCPEGKSQHIIVLSKGHIYRVPVSDGEGRRISQGDLAETLDKLSKENGKEGVLDLTAMTAGRRDDCALIQARFVASNVNNKNLLDQVEKAFCCVCLDDCEGTQEEDIGKQLLAGNGGNRCFDKTLQLIRLATGGIGVTIEHTPADAGAWFPLLRKINDALGCGHLLERVGLPSPGYERLTPEVDAALKKDLEKASDQFHSELGKVELTCVDIEGIRQDVLKNKRISPDAFYQLVFQLAAYYAGYDKPAVYESASMREYKHGRTDDLRSFSPESMTFLAAVSNQQIPDEMKTELLMKALEAHRQKIKDCKAGKGICRHLFALEKKWEASYPDDVAPELFTDPVYLDLVKRSTLSTSCVADSSVSRFVFGPVENDGMGIAYYPTEKDLRLTVSWRNNNRERALKFVDNLKPSADQLLKMLGITRG